MFYSWCLAGPAALVNTSEDLHGHLSAGLQLVAEVQLGIYPDETWLDVVSRAEFVRRATVSWIFVVLKQGTRASVLYSQSDIL